MPLKYKELPLYVAVIECDPDVSFETTSVDLPEPEQVPVPRTFVPSLNVTDPFGVPPYRAVTVAVSVTDCPYTEGFGEEISAVVVGALFTTCVTAREVLAGRCACLPHTLP